MFAYIVIIAYEAEKAGAVGTRSTTTEEAEQCNAASDEDEDRREMIKNC